jgi:hypothetical protein
MFVRCRGRRMYAHSAVACQAPAWTSAPGCRQPNKENNDELGNNPPDYLVCCWGRAFRVALQLVMGLLRPVGCVCPLIVIILLVLGKIWRWRGWRAHVLASRWRRVGGLLAPHEFDAEVTP